MNAKQYLKDNPKVDVIHGTSDGNLFFAKGDAVNHAKTLADKFVETVDRSAIKAESKEVKLKVNIPPSKNEKDVAKFTGMVAGLEKALASADAAKKPAIQKNLDAGKELLLKAQADLDAEVLAAKEKESEGK